MLQEQLCEKHVNNIIDLFCIDCQIEICERCHRTGLHKNHNAIDLSIYMEQSTSKMQEQLEKLKMKKTYFIKQYTQSENLIQQLNNFEVKMKNQIDSQNNKIQQNLEQRTEEQLQQLDLITQKIRQQLYLYNTLYKNQLQKVEDISNQRPSNVKEVQQLLQQSEIIIKSSDKKAPKTLEMNYNTDILDIQGQIKQLYNCDLQLKQNQSQKQKKSSSKAIKWPENENLIQNYYFFEPYLNVSLRILNPGNVLFVMRLIICFFELLNFQLNIESIVIEAFILYCIFYSFGSETKFIIFIQQIVFLGFLSILQLFTSQNQIINFKIFQLYFSNISSVDLDNKHQNIDVTTLNIIKQMLLIYIAVFFILSSLFYLDQFLCMKGNTKTFKRFKQASLKDIHLRNNSQQVVSFRVSQPCYLHGILLNMPAKDEYKTTNKVNAAVVQKIMLFENCQTIQSECKSITCFNNFKKNKSNNHETADFFYSKIITLKPGKQYTAVVNISGFCRKGMQERTKVETTEGNFYILFEKTNEKLLNLFRNFKDDGTVAGVIVRLMS